MTLLDSSGLDWEYWFNYIYINLFYLQTRWDSHDSTGLIWTRLDSSGLDWTQLGIFIELHLYQRDSHDSTGPDKNSSTCLGLFNELCVFHHFLLADSTNFGTKACRLVWDYLMNYIYITFLIFRLDWIRMTLLDSTGLLWTRLGILI